MNEENTEKELSPEQEIEARKEQMKEAQPEKKKEEKKEEGFIVFGDTSKEEPQRFYHPDYDGMIKRAIMVPTIMTSCEAKIHALSNKHATIDKEIKQLEEEMKKEVFEEQRVIKTEVKATKLQKEQEDYKPEYTTEYKPKFTNDKIREAEVSIRLNDNQGYKELVEARNDTNFDMMATKREMDEARRQMRSMELIVEIMKLKTKTI